MPSLLAFHGRNLLEKGTVSLRPSNINQPLEIMVWSKPGNSISLLSTGVTMQRARQRKPLNALFLSNNFDDNSEAKEGTKATKLTENPRSLFKSDHIRKAMPNRPKPPLGNSPMDSNNLDYNSESKEGTKATEQAEKPRSLLKSDHIRKAMPKRPQPPLGDPPKDVVSYWTGGLASIAEENDILYRDTAGAKVASEIKDAYEATSVKEIKKARDDEELRSLVQQFDEANRLVELYEEELAAAERDVAEEQAAANRNTAQSKVSEEAEFVREIRRVKDANTAKEAETAKVIKAKDLHTVTPVKEIKKAHDDAEVRLLLQQFNDADRLVDIYSEELAAAEKDLAEEKAGAERRNAQSKVSEEAGSVGKIRHSGVPKRCSGFY
eukprot:CAMPEP_0195521214 /NCGR_PEP_ID=MMETSP0794_2-20130614/18218_1 /TAXON_ID=515487 /ORGANISM="Stephanopyxis turris, Strain CCMP 815" /LENGTH=379 /DNA_ID=CAMNT_0040650721 /DNA_START=234 /DNA_END=1373 /DNA_ORIENTATION=-